MIKKAFTKDFIEDEKLNNIVKVIVDEINPKKLILFGSRGKDTASYNSDYDVAVDSKLINFTEKRKLKEKIDDVIGLSKIDIVFLKDVDKDFKNIIFKTGKVVYER